MPSRLSSLLLFSLGSLSSLLLLLALRRLMRPSDPLKQLPQHRLDSCGTRSASTGLPHVTTAAGCGHAPASDSTASTGGYLGDRIALHPYTYGSPSWERFIETIGSASATSTDA